MDKINLVRAQAYLILLLSLACVSCSYHGGVYLKNNTKNDLDINVQFEKNNMKSSLDFKINADGYDAWEYETGYFDKNDIDKSLVKITITTESGCEKTYSRKKIKEIAIKQGMWEILIDKKILDFGLLTNRKPGSESNCF